MEDKEGTNVTPLFGAENNQLAPSYELQAQYLEAVAKELREKQTTYERCLLVMQPTKGEIDIQPFGQQCTNMEFVGLLEMVKQKFLLDFFAVVR